MTRLTAEFWVHAYLARLRFQEIPAFVVTHGDDTAGEVLVKLNTLDGQATTFQRSFDLMSGERVMGGTLQWCRGGCRCCHRPSAQL